MGVDGLIYPWVGEDDQRVGVAPGDPHRGVHRRAADAARGGGADQGPVPRGADLELACHGEQRFHALTVQAVAGDGVDHLLSRQVHGANRRGRAARVGPEPVHVVVGVRAGEPRVGFRHQHGGAVVGRRVGGGSEETPSPPLALGVLRVAVGVPVVPGVKGGDDHVLPTLPSPLAQVRDLRYQHVQVPMGRYGDPRLARAPEGTHLLDDPVVVAGEVHQVHIGGPQGVHRADGRTWDAVGRGVKEGRVQLRGEHGGLGCANQALDLQLGHGLGPLVLQFEVGLHRLTVQVYYGGGVHTVAQLGDLQLVPARGGAAYRGGDLLARGAADEETQLPTALPGEGEPGVPRACRGHVGDGHVHAAEQVVRDGVLGGLEDPGGVGGAVVPGGVEAHGGYEHDGGPPGSRGVHEGLGGVQGPREGVPLGGQSDHYLTLVEVHPQLLAPLGQAREGARGRPFEDGLDELVLVTHVEVVGAL